MITSKVKSPLTHQERDLSGLSDRKKNISTSIGFYPLRQSVVRTIFPKLHFFLTKFRILHWTYLWQCTHDPDWSGQMLLPENLCISWPKRVDIYDLSELL